MDKKGCSRLFKVKGHRFVTFDFVLSLEFDSIQPSDLVFRSLTFEFSDCLLRLCYLKADVIDVLFKQMTKFKKSSQPEVRGQSAETPLNRKVLSLVIKIFK